MPSIEDEEVLEIRRLPVDSRGRITIGTQYSDRDTVTVAILKND